MCADVTSYWVQIKNDRNATKRSYTMNRIIMTAIAAATFSTAAYAGDMASGNDTLGTRAEAATVTVFERDRGISGSDMISALRSTSTDGAFPMISGGSIVPVIGCEMSPGAMINKRSTTLRSSRTLPGQP